MSPLAQVIALLAQMLILIVIFDALLSFILPPYHPVREVLGRIVNPMLNPIRRIVPLVGMFDFSPLILILLIELISRMLISLLQ